MKEKVAILFNPSAGKGRAAKKRQTLEKSLKEHAISFDWFDSRSEDDLRTLVEVTSKNYPILIAAGGDTTFLIVINEMLRLGLDNTLGMIGLGSCNDVVREFEIHSLKRACLAIKRNRSRRIDLGMALDGEKVLRYYPGQASIGLAVLINQYVERVIKRYPRLGKYQTISGIRGGWQALRSADMPMDLTVESEKGRVSGEFLLAVFNNIRYYAAGKIATPRARTDDGMLDAFLVKKCSFSRLAYITFFTAAGAYADKKEALTIQAPRFTVKSNKPFTVQIDGEILTAANMPRQFEKIEFASFPQALKIIS